MLIKLIGFNDVLWKISHNEEHHNFTNIEGSDPDLPDIGVFRFSPYQKKRFLHRYQHIYALPLYSLQTLIWVFKKDLQELLKRRRSLTTMTSIDFIFFKISYIFIFIVLPLSYWKWDWFSVLPGFFIMHMILGLTSSLVFLASHNVEEADSLPVMTSAIKQSWAEHQLNTTITHSRNSWFFKHLGGGINYQIEHHLFPYICHVHYPEISRIVKKTATEYAITYHEKPNIICAIASHLRLLQKLGNNNESQ